MYKQLCSASSSETMQHIPHTHVEQTGTSTALSLLRPSKRVKMPWEPRPLAPIFSRESFSKRFDVKPSQLGLADVLRLCPRIQVVSSEPMSAEAPLGYIRKRIACASHNIQDDERRSQALNHFRILLGLDLHATGIGESMRNCVGSLDASADVLQVLSDALSGKATGTLLKRAHHRYGAGQTGGQLLTEALVSISQKTQYAST